MTEGTFVFLYVLIGTLLGLLLIPYRQYIGSSQKESAWLFVLMTAFMWPVLLFCIIVAILHKNLQRWQFWQGEKRGILLIQFVGVLLILLVLVTTYRRTIFHFLD